MIFDTRFSFGKNFRMNSNARAPTTKMFENKVSVAKRLITVDDKGCINYCNCNVPGADVGVATVWGAAEPAVFNFGSISFLNSSRLAGL